MITNPWNRTLILVAAAGLLASAAYLTRPMPREVALVSDQGQPLAPMLTDPLAVRSLEVVSFDPAAAKTRAFSVRFDGKRWVIPSHAGYPADAADKVSSAASAFAGLVKERVVSDNPADHASLGVLDPSDDAAAISAGAGSGSIGTRVTLSDASRAVADLIIGKMVPDTSGSPFATPSGKRFVREAGKDRVYVTTLAAGFSTRFADWVQTDLLLTTAEQIRGVTIDHYQVDPERGITRDPVSIELTRTTPANDDASQSAQPPSVWTYTATPGGPPPEGQTINQQTTDELLRTLVGLRIIGVRAKPANLAKALSGAGAEVSLTLPDQISLQSRGFYLGPGGRLLANEGQVAVHCDDGVNYSLWFGGIVPDTEDAASGSVGGDAAPSPSADQARTPGDARYLMITVAFDPASIPEPPKPDALSAAEAAFALAKADFETAKATAVQGQPPADPNAPPSSSESSTPSQEPVEPPDLVNLRQQHASAVAEWKSKIDEGKRRADSLSRRFADWYYVIAADSLTKLRPKPDSLLKAADSDAAPAIDPTATSPPTTPTPPPPPEE